MRVAVMQTSAIRKRTRRGKRMTRRKTDEVHAAAAISFSSQLGFSPPSLEGERG
jgi:hypothetical protein